jgi:NMD protein affecting ribosome stability and mRNA decay
MPIYNFICDSCAKEKQNFLSIPEFISLKGKIKCENCNGGYFIHKISSVDAKIEKSTDQIILEIQEEVQKTVNKINNGNQRVIEDVYGDRPNPYKNKT